MCSTIDDRLFEVKSSVESLKVKLATDQAGNQAIILLYMGPYGVNYCLFKEGAKTYNRSISKSDIVEFINEDKAFAADEGMPDISDHMHLLFSKKAIQMYFPRAKKHELTGYVEAVYLMGGMLAEKLPEEGRKILSNYLERFSRTHNQLDYLLVSK